jgi:hypothetical protein
MIDKVRTLLAKFIVEHLTRPGSLVIRACFWLAAQTDDIEEKRRCLNAIFELDPENEPAHLTLPAQGQ